jgi:LacI family transcriptional regulator
MVCDGSPVSGYEFGRVLLTDPQNRPDAVIGSDGALLGVIRAAWELGLRIPQDVSLVGTDGVSMGAFFAPPLTAVDVQIARLGEIATRIVVEGASRQEFRQGVEVTPVRFVERASARLGN